METKQTAGLASGQQERRAVVTFLRIAAFFALCDVAVVPLAEMVRPSDGAAIVVPACFGLVAAQAGLLAIWGVLASGRVYLHLLASFESGALAYGFASVGAALSYFLYDSSGGQYSWYDYWQPWLHGLLCLPLIYLAVQSPLWLVRLLFGWQIQRNDRVPGTASPRSFTIRGIMAGTSVVALSLGAARLTDAWQPELAVGLAVLAAISVLSTLPAVALLMRHCDGLLATKSFAIYALVVTAITLTVLASFPPLGSGREFLLFLGTMILSFAAGLGGTLLIARRFGFRLVWGKETAVGRVAERQADG